MSSNNEIPRISSPSVQSGTNVSKEWADAHTTDKNGRTITRSHYWRRIFATDIRCGDSVEIKIAAKAGVSETTLSEVAGSLEINVGVLKSALAPKLSESETLSEERAIEFTRKLSAKPCRGLTFAEWQKIEKVKIRQPKRWRIFRSGFKEKAVENRTEDFFPDYYDYPAPECCPDDFKRKVNAGFTQIYGISFGGITSIAFAKPLKDGKIELFGVLGAFTPGQSLQLNELTDYFDSVGLAPTRETGRLSSSLGSAAQLLGSERSLDEPPHGFSATKWILLGAGAALLGYALSRKHEPVAQSEINDLLDRSVEELELSVRAYNVLKNANIQTIGELVRKTETEIMRITGSGRKSMNEIEDVLSTFGLRLGMKLTETRDPVGKTYSPETAGTE